MVEQIFKELDKDHNGLIDTREMVNKFKGKISKDDID